MPTYRIAYRLAFAYSYGRYLATEFCTVEADSPEQAILLFGRPGTLVTAISDVTNWTPLTFAKDAIRRHDFPVDDRECGCDHEQSCEGASKALRVLVEWIEKR